ncbi:MAG: HesA/MoeB/ThiF family protein [Candidatus Omnitrophica bacterium]|nr:HesA/MoeB/ThiF family protein [Candidatus Omnitrophota bacterium]
MPVDFTSAQRERYRKHLVFDIIGEKGQKKLLSSKALIVGVGGLGSPAALYLASCGVGTIGLVDSDALELSNLHRQVLYSTADIGKPKVSLAEKRLKEINPDVDIRAVKARVGADNATALLKDYDVILDCTDNFESKYLINDTCVSLGKALVHGGVYAFDGQVTFILPGKGPCYRCIFPELPGPGAFRNCRQAGILGSVPAVIGAVQANETLKYLLGIGRNLVGRLLRYDTLTGEIRISEYKKNEKCPVCGGK